VIAFNTRRTNTTTRTARYSAAMQTKPFSVRPHSRSSKIIATALLALVLPAALTACGGGAKARTGFIPRDVALNEVDDLTKSWRAVDFDPTQYSTIVVAPVTTPEMGAYGDLDAEQLETCRKTLEDALREAFAKPLANSANANGRTLVIRSAITAIKPNQPLRNIAPQTQILKRGYGYASCEIYATDGQGGPAVAAFMQTSDTQRFSDEKLSQTGTARRAAADWANAFRALLAR
jgi:hypothetical protein